MAFFKRVRQPGEHSRTSTHCISKEQTEWTGVWIEGQMMSCLEPPHGTSKEQKEWTAVWIGGRMMSCLEPPHLCGSSQWRNATTIPWQ
jgi:hypothetical protein